MFYHATGFRIKSLGITYFHMSNLTLSLALNDFTTEFGMDSGGSRSLMSPGETGNLLLIGSIYILRVVKENLIFSKLIF